MKPFTIFPAIDLRSGQVVRLSQGDPDRQKTYSMDPAGIAQTYLDAGANWLHIVNLDATFGEPTSVNITVLQKIIKIADQYQAHIQFGGGIHSVEMARRALSSGISRIILGSLAVKEPETVGKLMKEYRQDQVGVSLDSADKKVMISGWREPTNINIFDLAAILKSNGVSWIVYTDINRDGMQIGSDFDTTIELHEQTGLNVIASGGVSSLSEISLLKEKGVAGAIIGRALYEGTLKLAELLSAANQIDEGKS
jgi:phosphoribosylformimino-5-aminoimidazole carboxamide ribotide isomerase